MTVFLAILLFLVLSAFFSGSEIAFISANKLGIEIKKEEGSSKGQILGGFFNRPDSFLGTMLVGNNIALVVLTYFMTEGFLTPLIADFITDDMLLLLVNTLIITIVVLLFGEYLPKTLFRLFANETLYFLAYPLKFFKVLLKIPTWVMIEITNLIMGVFVKAPQTKLTEALTRTDLQHYIEDTISAFNEDIDQEIFTNALNLNQLKVRDCMIPRPEIVDYDVNDPVDGLIDLFKKSRHSRLIISNGDIENVIGYVHHQQFLNNPKTFKKLVLDISFVPEAMNVRDLMNDFIKERTNIACVVDEFGGTAGLITLEDILEEIFGEIEDEHDKEDLIEKTISESEYLFSGRVEIDHINESYEHLEFPTGEYHTLSGYLVMTSGKIPDKKGEQIEQGGYLFTIEKIGETKIELIRVKKQEFPAED